MWVAYGAALFYCCGTPDASGSFKSGVSKNCRFLFSSVLSSINGVYSIGHPFRDMKPELLLHGSWHAKVPGRFRPEQVEIYAGINGNFGPEYSLG